jgi:hypothetical protein
MVINPKKYKSLTVVNNREGRDTTYTTGSRYPKESGSSLSNTTSAYESRYTKESVGGATSNYESRYTSKESESKLGKTNNYESRYTAGAGTRGDDNFESRYTASVGTKGDDKYESRYTASAGTKGDNNYETGYNKDTESKLNRSTNGYENRHLKESESRSNLNNSTYDAKHRKDIEPRIVSSASNLNYDRRNSYPTDQKEEQEPEKDANNLRNRDNDVRAKRGNEGDGYRTYQSGSGYRPTKDYYPTSDKPEVSSKYQKDQQQDFSKSYSRFNADRNEYRDNKEPRSEAVKDTKRNDQQEDYSSYSRSSKYDYQRDTHNGPKYTKKEEYRSYKPEDEFSTRGKQENVNLDDSRHVRSKYQSEKRIYRDNSKQNKSFSGPANSLRGKVGIIVEYENMYKDYENKISSNPRIRMDNKGEDRPRQLDNRSRPFDYHQKPQKDVYIKHNL